MKYQVMETRFPILTAILMVLGLLIGSSAQLSLPPSAQVTQDPLPARRINAGTTSNDSQSNRETDRLTPVDEQ